MAKDLSKPLREITFHCNFCRAGRTFKAEPRVVDAPAEEHHPFAYFADCPECHSECEQVDWERNLVKAWSNATGPKTPEGKAASAKNLAGHPTPEEARRTRFNAMKHGMSARVAKYFPAKPDGYAFCSGCEVDRIWCREQPACVKQAENFLLHHAAFEQRNPEVLRSSYGDLHAVVFSVLQQCLQTIMADGVSLRVPEWYVDAETGKKIACQVWDDGIQDYRTIVNVQAHPLFKPVAELLSRVGLTLTDMGMTIKSIEGGDESEMGSLSVKNAPLALEDYSKQQADNTAALQTAMREAAQLRNADPVLIEYNQQQGKA